MIIINSCSSSIFCWYYVFFSKFIVLVNGFTNNKLRDSNLLVIFVDDSIVVVFKEESLSKLVFVFF